ncbi:AER109Wp [Eremothecium gossypii ATCC 10895]|uniref:Synaptobrevin homolog YKT6 n=1 Tax=Eremothecium gossypii (strain ATCC 10895 / CBS 109.51 / FGSC 9923 / NRRL Y-1056) TaxID=284811 RepID=YKT6_EREGS|nr:AER109Wp [Eremothecium gossypii ATCC 10895]Q757A4.1 RecName: Full=Synaptobrevin homolog YKT6; Flags: Precursor [Eremothecium gossypii ATCC 10895]AAS52793.1 AER109Wp [Eremothecium gossypii ATCC 10895]AEY97099.1 FAER109Wp [Eremothecium gossypii FDAG1]
MKIYSIAILRNSGNKALELCSAKDLSQFGFFERNGVSQFMTFFGETVAGRTGAGQRQSIEEGNYVGHVYSRSEGLCGVLITDKEYPVRPAYTLLNKVLDEYLVAHPPAEWRDIAQTSDQLKLRELEMYLAKYQDPSQADSIMRVQQELDETKIVLHKTIESVLQRGEKLDNLVDKSESLSASSRMFYKQAKKTNSCCLIM